MPLRLGLLVLAAAIASVMAGVLVGACTSTRVDAVPEVTSSVVATASTTETPSTTRTAVTTTTTVPKATTTTTVLALDPSNELTAVAAIVSYGRVNVSACGIGAPNQEVVLSVVGIDSGVVIPLDRPTTTTDARGVFCWEGLLPDLLETADGKMVPVDPGAYQVTAEANSAEIATGEVTIPEEPDPYAAGVGYVARGAERPRGIDEVAYHALNGFLSRLVGDPEEVVVRQAPMEGAAALGSEVWVETGPTVHDAQSIGYEAWSMPEPAFGRYYESWGFDAEWDYRRLIDAALSGSEPQMSRTMTLLRDALPEGSVPVAQSWTISDWEPGSESGTYYLAETGEFLIVTIQPVDPPFAFNDAYLGRFEPIDDGWTQRIDVGGDPASLFRIAQLSPDGTLLVDLWLEAEPPTDDGEDPPPHANYDEASAGELMTTIRRRIAQIRSGEVAEPDGPLNEREWLLLDAFDRMGVDARLGEPSHGGTDAVRGFLWHDGASVYVYADAPDTVALLAYERGPSDSFFLGRTLVQESGATDDPVYTWFCGFTGFEATGLGGAMPRDAVDAVVTELCG